MQLMDKKELVKYLDGKLTHDTLGRLTREGKIPFIKFPGIRRYFYDVEAIERWLNNLQAESMQPPGDSKVLKLRA